MLIWFLIKKRFQAIFGFSTSGKVSGIYKYVPILLVFVCERFTFYILLSASSLLLLLALPVVLIFSKPSFPKLWELAESDGHHWTHTDSTSHKQPLGAGVLAALQFQTRCF